MNKKNISKKIITKKRTKKFIEKEIYNNITPRNILYACIIGIFLAVITITFSKCDSENHTNDCYCDNATAPIKSKTNFRDINAEHLRHAQANGLNEIIKDRDDFESKIDSLIDENILVKIKPNKYYNIRHLTHSFPYLVPEARDLLNLIGKRFQSNLQESGLPKYKFQISSLLRTIEFQKQLTKQNVNATWGISAHYYGTTFDIAYDKYDRRGKSFQDAKVEAVMEKTLKELRAECKLMIIREKSNKCFHITTVLPKE